MAAPPCCALRVEGECVVKIAGLGSKVESIIVENLKNAYRRLPLIIDEWMSVRHLHIADMSPIPVGSPMSGRAPASTAPPLQSQHSSGSFGSFHSADSELDSPPGSDAEAQGDPPTTTHGKYTTPADTFGGFFTTPGAQGSRDGDAGGERTHAPRVRTRHPREYAHARQARLSPRGRSRQRGRGRRRGRGWDSGRNARTTRGRQRALETPARKGRDGVSLRVFPALVFLFREGRAVAVGRGRRRRRGLVDAGKRREHGHGGRGGDEPVGRCARGGGFAPHAALAGGKKRSAAIGREGRASREGETSSVVVEKLVHCTLPTLRDARAPSAIRPGVSRRVASQTHLSSAALMLS